MTDLLGVNVDAQIDHHQVVGLDLAVLDGLEVAAHGPHAVDLAGNVLVGDFDLGAVDGDGFELGQVELRLELDFATK